MQLLRMPATSPVLVFININCFVFYSAASMSQAAAPPNMLLLLPACSAIPVNAELLHLLLPLQHLSAHSSFAPTHQQLPCQLADTPCCSLPQRCPAVPACLCMQQLQVLQA
jgi:hypothetical protein